MIHQARLDAVKLYFSKRNEKCDDKRARTKNLTEAQYLSCKLEWCNTQAWEYLSNYWTTEEYFIERRRAQESRLKSEEDVAQNRGGSRPWTKTQQFLEYKYGPEKAGTLNTYVVMKSGIRNIDRTGNSAPICSQKERRRLEDYKAGAQPDDKSQEFDGKVLYVMEGGLRHGRVPIDHGAVDKEAVLAAGRSRNIQQTNGAAYRCVVEENEVLKETYEELMQSNEHLKETNEILIEENGVTRELILRFYSEFGKQPPADLLNRLASIDAHRQQGTGLSQAGSHQGDLNNNGNGTDSGNGGGEDSDDMHGGDGRDDDDYNDMDEDNGGGEENMQD